MVAKAAWLTVEPEINLVSYLASEEPRFLSSASLDSLTHDWDAILDDLELSSTDDEAREKG